MIQISVKMIQDFDFNKLLNDFNNNFNTSGEDPNKVAAIGSAGDGAVEIKLNSKFECMECTINWDAIDDNKNVANDLIAVAFTMATRELMKKTISNTPMISNMLQKIFSEK